MKSPLEDSSPFSEAIHLLPLHCFLSLLVTTLLLPHLAALSYLPLAYIPLYNFLSRMLHLLIYNHCQKEKANVHSTHTSLSHAPSSSTNIHFQTHYSSLPRISPHYIISLLLWISKHLLIHSASGDHPLYSLYPLLFPPKRLKKDSQPKYPPISVISLPKKEDMKR